MPNASDRRGAAPRRTPFPPTHEAADLCGGSAGRGGKQLQSATAADGRSSCGGGREWQGGRAPKNFKLPASVINAQHDFLFTGTNSSQKTCFCRRTLCNLSLYLYFSNNSRIFFRKSTPFQARFF